ncbi:MAG: hypothetical protein Q7O66_06950, partial [Dehalococcoidia bacterium]|nr:hypothetical protein [Dehalococcoidia bacterium]
MPKEAKKLSPALFVLIIVFFFLPFVSVTCGGTKAATLSGMQLVTGTTIEQPAGFGQKSSAREIGAEPTAIAAIALAVMGLVFSSSKGARGAAFTAIVGVAGALSLLFLKTRIDGEIQKQATGLLQTNYEIGFWLA